MTLRASLDDVFLKKTSTSNQQIDVLDGLRGMAVLLVVLSHLANVNSHAVSFLDFSGTGKYGVYLFFVLSAFLLTKPFVTANAKLSDVKAWRRYALRRALRIFPLYWFVLAANWFFTEIAPTDTFPTLSTELWKQHMWMQAGKGPYWTIPVEFSYYLVLPLFALVVRGLRRNLKAVTAFVAATIAASSWIWPPSETPLNSLNLGYYLPVFLLGSYAAVLDSHIPSKGAARFEGAAIGCLGLVLLAFASIMSALIGEDVHRTWQHDNYIGFGLCWSLFVLAMLRSRKQSWLMRFFSSVPLRIIGVVSFSVYLWHGPVVRFVLLHRVSNDYANAWIAIALSIALAMLSYVCIERPMMRGALVRRVLR